MNYIHLKIKHIPGLRTTLSYWDDTALVGTPTALATAAKIISDCWPETGLRMRWDKCHIYGTPSTINACRSTQNPKLPGAITMHEDLDIEWLKAPIGSTEWVSRWLQGKLSELQEITQSICAMEYKHEAGTLLRECAAVCRIVHLMRPPNANRQLRYRVRRNHSLSIRKPHRVRYEHTNLGNRQASAKVRWYGLKDRPAHLWRTLPHLLGEKRHQRRRHSPSLGCCQAHQTRR